jgi:hypothetical protein
MMAGTAIPPTLFVRLHPATVTVTSRAAIALLLADSADTDTDTDTDIMTARARARAILRAQVGVMSGVGIVGMLMKCGAADGVKVERFNIRPMPIGASH